MEYKSLPYLGNDVALDGMQRFALPMHRYCCMFTESNDNLILPSNACMLECNTSPFLI